MKPLTLPAVVLGEETGGLGSQQPWPRDVESRQEDSGLRKGVVGNKKTIQRFCEGLECHERERGNVAAAISAEYDVMPSRPCKTRNRG